MLVSANPLLWILFYVDSIYKWWVAGGLEHDLKKKKKKKQLRLRWGAYNLEKVMAVSQHDVGGCVVM